MKHLKKTFELPERYRLLEENSFMTKFTVNVAKKDGYRSYFIYTKPDKLFEEVVMLEENQIRIMIASLIKPNETWNVCGIGRRFSKLTEFSENLNEAEKSTPTCVAVALHRLGFDVSLDQRVGYGVGFGKTKNILYGGHVMAVINENGCWGLEDQTGKILFRDTGDFSRIVTRLAEFRLSIDPEASQGYCFRKI